MTFHTSAGLETSCCGFRDVRRPPTPKNSVQPILPVVAVNGTPRGVDRKCRGLQDMRPQVLAVLFLFFNSILSRVKTLRCPKSPSSDKWERDVCIDTMFGVTRTVFMF